MHKQVSHPHLSNLQTCYFHLVLLVLKVDYHVYLLQPMNLLCKALSNGYIFNKLVEIKRIEYVD